MSVVPVTLETQLRCKLCKHEKRREIDELIAAQRRGEFNRDELLARIGALGVENPTVDNIKAHVGTEKKPKHVKFVTEKEIDEAQKAVSAEVAKLQAGDFQPVDPDQLLQLQLKAYEGWLQAKLAANEDVHLTHDHAIKIVGEMTKRRHNQAQQDLLGAVTGGILQALNQAEKPALPAGEQVIEVEAAEESEWEVVLSEDGHNSIVPKDGGESA